MKLIHSNLLNSFWKKGILPIKTDLDKKIATSKIVNNLLTTKAGYVLDARQGKVLQDKVSEINSKLFDASSSNPISGYDVIDDSYIHRSTFGQVDLYANMKCNTLQGKWHTVAMIPEGYRPNIHRRLAAYVINNDGTFTAIGCFAYTSGEINVYNVLPTGLYHIEVFGSYSASAV